MNLDSSACDGRVSEDVDHPESRNAAETEEQEDLSKDEDSDRATCHEDDESKDQTVRKVAAETKVDLVEQLKGKSAIAIDCEMIDCYAEGSSTEIVSRVVSLGLYVTSCIDVKTVNIALPVSIGVVNRSFESVFYARVCVPTTARVFDDSFARTTGKLGNNWTFGLPLPTTRGVLLQLMKQVKILVGWQIDNDLKVLEFHHAEQSVQNGKRSDVELLPGHSHLIHRLVDMSDHIRSGGGHRIKLLEAYSEIFKYQPTDYVSQAHNASHDARMTMELFNYWVNLNCPQVIQIKLKFYVVNVCRFEKKYVHHEVLWKYLRPERGGAAVVIEHEEGKKYKLKFREEQERAAYIALVRRKLLADGQKLASPVPMKSSKNEKCTAGIHYNSKFFILHVYEMDR